MIIKLDIVCDLFVNGYNLLFDFYNWIYLVICLATDTIDDLVLYLRSEEEHALDF